MKCYAIKSQGANLAKQIKYLTQHLNLKHWAMKKLSSLGCTKVVQDAIQ
jgi:hypothetical protein